MSFHIFTGTAAPTITPSFVGDHFIDTTNDNTYISVGTASSADWKITNGVNTHASTHIKAGSDEIDGDQLDIDFTPSNYTPSTVPAEASDVDHLTAHLAGIDNAIMSASFHEYNFFAGNYSPPVNADWAVNALAPAVADTNNNGLVAWLFDDTTEEGIGFEIFVPASVTNAKFTFLSRPETAPPGARTGGVKLYERGLPGAVDSWSSGTVLTDIVFTTNENWLTDTQTVTISTLGWTAGQVHQLELTRPAPTGGTDLTGDWALQMFRIEFT